MKASGDSASSGSLSSRLTRGVSTPDALGGGVWAMTTPGSPGEAMWATTPCSKPRRRMLMEAVRSD